MDPATSLGCEQIKRVNRPRKCGKMYSMFKLVSWNSVVTLGCKLSTHSSEGTALRNEFISLGMCPQNNLSMGGREATKEGRWVVGTRSPLQEKMLLDGEYTDIDGLSQDDDSFLRELSLFTPKNVDTLKWVSRTSGTKITCTLLPSGSWLAHIEGSQPSAYGRFWAEML